MNGLPARSPFCMTARARSSFPAWKIGLIGQKIAATLASTGTPSFFLHPAEGVHGDLGMLAKQDALIAISNSGETQEVLQLLPFVKRLNVRLWR